MLTLAVVLLYPTHHLLFHLLDNLQVSTLIFHPSLLDLL
jgi:hypothetical protein